MGVVKKTNFQILIPNIWYSKGFLTTSNSQLTAFKGFFNDSQLTVLEKFFNNSQLSTLNSQLTVLK